MEQSRTAYVILGMLSIEPNKSGYDIRKAIEDTVGHFWSESYGQIYPTLKRLTDKGMIVSTKPNKDARKGRQQYSLTDEGRACLSEWLAIPYQNDPPRNEFLLKLFFGREVDLSVSIVHVRDYQEKNRKLLATLAAVEKFAQGQPSGEAPPPHWMLTLTLGIALSRTALEWSEDALDKLASMQKEANAKQKNKQSVTGNHNGNGNGNGKHTGQANKAAKRVKARLH